MSTEDIVVPPKDEEELNLEKLVFGDQSGFEANLRKIENLYDYSDGDDDFLDKISEDEGSLIDENEDDMFFIDEGANSAVTFETDNDSMDVENDQHIEEEFAWMDSDDEKIAVSVTSTRLKKLRETQEEQSLSGLAYQARLRAQYEKIYPRPTWADNWGNEREDNDEYLLEAEEDAQVGLNIATLTAILKSTDNFLQASTKLLPAHKIEILRLKDANIVRRSRGAIQSMDFHPLHPLLITGGFDRTLRIYHIDGKTNQFVSLIHLRDLPIQTCQFLTLENSSLVYMAGRRRYMNRWDLTTGEVEKILRMYGQEKFQKSYEYFKISPFGTYIALLGSSGWVNLVSGKTGQFVRGFKINGFVSDFVFTRDEKTLIVSNESGEFWEFSMDTSSNKPSCRWTDSSAVNVTKIKLGGPSDRWLAVGTKSGVVNIFDRSTFEGLQHGMNPKPFKEVTNLVTSISHLAFSPDGQVMCVSSKQKKDALKLVHLPLGTVFSNWPTSGTPLGRVTVAEFSPNSQMLAIGNDTGKVTLWRLNHY
ncbi:WD40 repeat-like protein [Metschnikowia bicuspidata var. bicuspidata NRRL YB-4993]|uniref:WD40 repeat-like protein n=1 Tax=Metschnikowia bicuspidata var. bicuspidata NRRL YB-4993 TaxID=869754 RepID=A0A1A0HBG0_9ASCO|nr:WD40 repeat-like protein [Metschnikowia bicuspidata var. bicuspidata NRRL YB-4993]OBA21223.1 WD40 repeat-like protein [Metschnikowia bicuspidata var. bicuspidata NRRL YB-4993]